MLRTGHWMIAGALLLAGCGDGDDLAAPEPTTESTLLPPAAPTPPTSPPVSRETADPDVVSRGMTPLDVAVDLSGHGPLPDGYERAAVPADAWPVDLVTVDGRIIDVETREAIPVTGAVLVSAEFEACELISLWALPQPEQVAIGYEEHPGIDCDAPNELVAVFSLPRSGLNSEGAWEYLTDPPVELLRRVGTGAEG